ncbi:hypothetical protein C8Q80DRAFT_797050 [Daedaleopsis nitida]|nr:hypothetical protein C8Q80DRAFT_797050 [Daedaleopsis nitida]
MLSLTLLLTSTLPGRPLIQEQLQLAAPPPHSFCRDPSVSGRRSCWPRRRRTYGRKSRRYRSRALPARRSAGCTSDDNSRSQDGRRLSVAHEQQVLCGRERKTCSITSRAYSAIPAPPQTSSAPCMAPLDASSNPPKRSLERSWSDRTAPGVSGPNHSEILHDHASNSR